MIMLLLHLFRVLPVLFGSHRQLALKNFAYYHQARTHLALDKAAPDSRPIEPPERGTIIPIPEVGGLHHRYVRHAA